MRFCPRCQKYVETYLDSFKMHTLDTTATDIPTYHLDRCCSSCHLVIERTYPPFVILQD